MDETLMGHVHDMRNRLFVLRELIHYHMQSDKRFTAEEEIRKVAEDLERIYTACLRCRGEDPNSHGS